MPRAILEIDANTAGIVAAFGQIRTQAQETERVVRASMGNLFSGIPRGSRQAQQSVARDSAQMGRDAERAAQASVRAFIRGEEQKRRAAQLTAEGRARAERQASEHAAAEARKRNLTAEQEARVRQSVLERTTRAVEREERQQTATAEREARRRERAGRDIAFGLRRGLNVGRDAAMPVAREAHSQIQDARRQRAEADRGLYFAVTGADRGATSADVASARNQVRAFAQSAGMEYQDVVAALRQGQEAGSVLERQDGETSAQAITRALQMVEEGRALGTDPGGYLTAQGRLRQAGLRGENLTQAMRFAAVAANAGAVEIGQLMQQGLPGAQRLMSQRVSALGPGASAEAQQAAMLGAFRESVATQEVTAAAGSRSRQVSNALASLQTFMATPRRQQQALTNIQREFEATARTPEGERRRAGLRALYEGESAIFERDPTRRDPHAMRLRTGISPIELASRVTSAMGGDAQAAANIFAGGGVRNPQAFLSNQRELMAFLGGPQGESIRRMMGQPAYAQEDINRRKQEVRGDDLSAMTKAQEEGRNALTDNTSKLKELSDTLANFAAANPILSTALQTGGGLVSGVLGGAMINRLGNYAATGSGPVASVVRFLTGAGEAGATVAGAGEAGAAGAGSATLAAPVMLATATVGAIVNSARTAVSGTDISGREVGTGRRLMAGAGTVLTPLAMSEGGRQIGEAIGQYIVAAMRETPVTATVSPVDAAHAATTAAPRR